MQVKFYNELIECPKYNFGDGFGKIPLSEFKDRIFTKKYLLESFIILAAKSRVGSNISFVSDDVIKDKNSKYFFENLEFLLDIDFKSLNGLLKTIDYNDYPKDRNFYFMIEFWGKHVLFMVSS